MDREGENAEKQRKHKTTKCGSPTVSIESLHIIGMRRRLAAIVLAVWFDVVFCHEHHHEHHHHGKEEGEEGGEEEEEEEEEREWWLPFTYKPRYAPPLGTWYEQLAMILVVFVPVGYAYWHYFGKPSRLRSQLCQY